MSLCLVLHDLGPAASADVEKVFFEAIFEIAPEHWRITGEAVLVGTGVSPAYLRDHLLRTLKKQGVQPAMLLVTRVAADMTWHGLSPEGETWLREVLG
jgi:hypothetical protein